PGSDRLLHQPGRSHDLSDWEITNPEISRRGAHAAGTKIQSPRVPRFRLEKRQCADRVAGAGVPRAKIKTVQLQLYRTSFSRRRGIQHWKRVRSPMNRN